MCRTIILSIISKPAQICDTVFMQCYTFMQQVSHDQALKYLSSVTEISVIEQSLCCAAL